MSEMNLQILQVVIQTITQVETLVYQILEVVAHDNGVEVKAGMELVGEAVTSLVVSIITKNEIHV